MTVTELRAMGVRRGTPNLSKEPYTASFLPKVRIEVVVAPDMLDRVVDAVTSAARTGQIGDGKIFVTNIEHAVRIRTGERDLEAV